MLKWYVDASFAVHPDFKLHTGAVLTMGEGTLQSMSSKQKMITRSSCKSELVGTDDAITKILWHYKNFRPNFDLGIAIQGLIREKPRPH